MRLYLAAGTEGAAAAGLRAPLLLVCAAIEDAEADDSAEPARNDFPEPKVDEMHQARMCVPRSASVRVDALTLNLSARRCDTGRPSSGTDAKWNGG